MEKTFINKATTGNQLLMKSSSTLIVLVIMGIALALRILPGYDSVFGPEWVNFQGVDAWYHIRLIENLLQHFPHQITFDPFTYFPNGQDVFFAPLYDFLIAACAWLVGGGSPDIQTIEVVSAYFPAVLGALVCIPIFFIGKELFNKPVGFLAALFISILPSPFLMRSRLGYVDHHVAEVLFSTITILFLILALKKIQNNPVSLDDIRNKNWKRFIKPLLFAVLSGAVLGIYLMVWVGGLLFVFIIFCFFILMYFVHYLKRENSDYLNWLSVPVFLISLIIILFFVNQLAYGLISLAALVIAVLAVPLISLCARAILALKLKRIYLLVLTLVSGAVGLTIFYFLSPENFDSFLKNFAIFVPNTYLQTISEARPLFFAQGPFSLMPAWKLFTTGLIMAPIAFVLIAVSLRRSRKVEIIFFLLTSLLIFLATMGQIRFAEYLAISIALLTGYLAWWIVEKIPVILKWLEFKAPETKSSSKKNKTVLKQSQQNRAYAIKYKLAYVVVSVVLVFFLNIFPNISPAIETVSTNTGVDADWYAALSWMKSNTPDPFQDPGFFNAFYEEPDRGEHYPYPPSAYGVMNWWTKGHLVTQLAHRIPVSNPHQSGASSAANYFISEDETSANRRLTRLGAKYVIVDVYIASPLNEGNVSSGFPALATWASEDLTTYYETYYREEQGQYISMTLFYPEYYQTMIARLYNFSGDKVAASDSISVISFIQKSGRKIINSSQTFRTYSEAKAFIDKQISSNYRIVSSSPLTSPIPLEKLVHYREVYRSSSDTSNIQDVSDLPAIRIFEYIP